MGFANLKAVGDAHVNGQVGYSTWRKRPVAGTTGGYWYDLSLAPGNPSPQYYAATPLKATALALSTDGGIYHGPSVAPATKHLRSMTFMSDSATPLPMVGILLDVCLYYPFVDEGSTDVQPCDNTVTLPRHTTGEGVRIMAVSLGARTGGSVVNVSYTNQAGVAGRTSTFTQNAPAGQPNGLLISSVPASATTVGPFLALQTGDTGVRSVESVTMVTPDVGLFALVLVRPIAQMQIRGVDAPVEIDYLLAHGGMPRIVDDAHLALVVNPVGNVNTVGLHGDITTVWN